MTKTDKATTIIKLLKKGYSPKEITQRVAVSYNYAWKLKRDLENAAKEVVAEVKEWVEPKPAEFVQADTNVDAILDARAATYGSFFTQAAIAQSIKEDIRVALDARGRILAPDQHEALDMIAGKIARIVNGDSDYADSWVDIAGYAQLVVDRLQGKVR